tara:strand:+ start:5476 stop:5721 length:246 start_codon:yes stop_codon:yes gene_type:complete
MSDLLTYKQLTEKLKLQRGEKLVKKFKAPKSGKEIAITDFGDQGFMLYFDGEPVDDSLYNSVKDAEKSAKELMKLFDEGIE